eukprot:m.311878 g.311878  ORF g.311878 m.311878 type:complete len:97 (-) comp55376_c0_seq2:25-315(-)
MAEQAYAPGLGHSTLPLDPKYLLEDTQDRGSVNKDERAGTGLPRVKFSPPVQGPSVTSQGSPTSPSVLPAQALTGTRGRQQPPPRTDYVHFQVAAQ